MSYEYVLTERDGPVGIVTLNRPRQLNALSSAVLTELADALEAHERDDEIRVLILTGGRMCSRPAPTSKSSVHAQLST